MEQVIDDRLTFNVTQLASRPQWLAGPEIRLPSWAEAVVRRMKRFRSGHTLICQMLVTILFGGMWLTRRHNYCILKGGTTSPPPIFDESLDESASLDELIELNGLDAGTQSSLPHSGRISRVRSCCDLSAFRMSHSSSQFRYHFHSRLCQKFPFVVEMFYWLLNYLFYRMTTILSNKFFAGEGIWHVAQAHAVSILTFEHFSRSSFLFPCRESDIQQWFMNGHQDILTFLDRFYSLVHVPGSMAFIVWYYYVAPSHASFACVRRTLALTTLMAFVTFVVFPVMPPRLLPTAYGFLDTVHMEEATSLWQSGKHVNSLAAMPSMHFGYSFIIGCVLIYHSGVCQSERRDARKSLFWKIFYVTLGLVYPALILVTILATANHFFLDALVALCYCKVAFAANRVFCVLLPLEKLFLWLLRVEKPVPSTGKHSHTVGVRRLDISVGDEV